MNNTGGLFERKRPPHAICYVMINISSRPSFNYNFGQEYLKTSYYQASSTWHLFTQLDVFAWEILKYFDCEWGGWKEKLVWSSFLIFSPHHQSGIWKRFPCFWRSPTWWKNLVLNNCNTSVYLNLLKVWIDICKRHWIEESSFVKQIANAWFEGVSSIRVVFPLLTIFNKQWGSRHRGSFSLCSFCCHKYGLKLYPFYRVTHLIFCLLTIIVVLKKTRKRQIDIFQLTILHRFVIT